MNEKINLYDLASIIAADPEQTELLFTPVQIEYLDYCIKTDLNKEEIEALGNYEKSQALTDECQSAIQKLRVNPRLMFILGLGDHTVRDLIDTLALLVTGAYMGTIEFDEETDSYYLAIDPIDDSIAESTPRSENDDRFNHDVVEFLKSYTPSGTPRRYEGIYIDQHCQMIDDIYPKILNTKVADAKTATIQDAIEQFGDEIWIELTDEQRKAITENDRITNDELLQFYLYASEKVLTRLLGPTRKNIESYFKFWLGENWKDYSDASEF